MKFVEESKILCLRNILKYRSIIFNHEMDEIIENMVSFAQSKDKVKANKVLTITKGLNFESGKQKMDMEFMVELNQPTKGNNIYSFISKYEIANCIYSKYKGNPQNASMATKEVNEYIKKNELNPIGPVHQVMLISKKKKKKQTKNEVSLEVYVQVS